jgi:tetratricopeptide (TPR) repeat protein
VHQPEKLEAIAGLLARHFREAGDKERALKYYMLAGKRAVRLFAHEEAIQHLQTALDLLETGERVETQLGLLEELAGVHSQLMKKAQAISNYQAALDLWSTLAGADEMIAVRLHRKILETLLIRWDETREERSQTLAASRIYLEARVPLAQREPHLEWVRALTALANITDMGLMSPEELDTAERYAQAAVDLADQLDAPEELSDALEALGGVHFVRGRLPEQLEVSHRRLALSRDPRFGDLHKQVYILEGHSDALIAVGEYAQAMHHLQEMEELAVEIGSIASQVWALSLQTLCLFRLDRWEELFKLEEKLGELERRSSREQLVGGGNCVVLSISAATHALQGDLDQARVMREQAYAIMAGQSGATENWERTKYY